MFTSADRMKGRDEEEVADFPGFEEDRGMEVSFRIHQRKMYSVEELVHQLVQRMDRSDSEQVELKMEVQSLKKELRKAYMKNIELEEENVALRMKMQEDAEEIKNCKEEIKSTVTVAKEQHKAWKKGLEEVQTDFRDIVKQQGKERNELAQGEIVKVLQQKEAVIRNIAEKKRSVVVSGLKEEKTRDWQERRVKEEERVRTLVNKISEEENMFGEVEDYMRLGKYEEGKSRAMKITLKSQVATECLLRNAWKLKDSHGTKMIFVRRNMSQEERAKMRELVGEVKDKNEARTEEEKKQFFWKVRNDRVWKWWTKERE